ncbi:hypothetical protein ACRBEV_05240 [Methylobacterium phyllosphaerae]
MPIFTSAALDSDPDGLALLHAVLHGTERTGSAQTRPAPSWGCAADLKPSRPVGRRAGAQAGKRQAAARPVCFA